MTKISNILAFLLFVFISAVMAGCTREAATILVYPSTGSLASGDTGTIHPMIQNAYPGKLQTLDIPESIPVDISPDYPGIIVVFSHPMENDSNEMDTALELIEVATGLPSVGINIAPASTSRYFNIEPASGSLKPDTDYILRVHKSAFAETVLDTVSVSRSANIATIVTAASHGLKNNEIITVSGFLAGHAGYNTAGFVTVQVVDKTTFTYSNTGANEGTAADTDGRISVYHRTLVFDNLVNPPATSLSPADPVYVEYRFRTGHATPDTLPPFLVSTNPSDGDINVPIDLSPGVGYVEIVLSDNTVPMIDPFTVHSSSVTLYDITNSAYVSGNVVCDFTDTDFKTIRFYPFPVTELQPNANHRLSVSITGPPAFLIKDFAGNSMTQADVFFTTGN